MKRWDVLGFGAVAVDDLLYLDVYPEPSVKMPVRETARAGGGLVATGLVAAARLGACAAFGAVLGYDDLSTWTLAELAREGVDCAPVVRRQGARPFHSTVLVDRSTGGRTILYSAAGVTPLTLAEIGPDVVGACRLLFVDHTIGGLALHLSRLAHNLAVPVLVDLERWGDDPEAIRTLICEADHLIVGLAFAAEMTGERAPGRAAETLRRMGNPGRPACVVTAGENGAWYTRAGDDEAIHCPACTVDVVDTTGCGDVFHGAYAADIAAGASIDEAVAVATIAAGLKAMQRGGREGIPDRESIARYRREHSKEGET